MKEDEEEKWNDIETSDDRKITIKKWKPSVKMRNSFKLCRFTAWKLSVYFWNIISKLILCFNSILLNLIFLFFFVETIFNFPSLSLFLLFIVTYENFVIEYLLAVRGKKKKERKKGNWNSDTWSWSMGEWVARKDLLE